MENYDNIYEPDKGNLIGGIIGALIGALIGMVAWVAVLMMGYVASIVGLLIAWLSSKGYDLLHGRQGAIKAVVIIVCVILAVVGGTVVQDMINSIQVYNEELANASALEARLIKTEYPSAMDFALYYLQDAENQGYILKNCGLGLLFGLLGAVSFVFGKKKENAKAAQPDSVPYVESSEGATFVGNEADENADSNAPNA